ncbi:MAG: hypothetical protein IT204_21500 [Fimbriimonadaceae bacterium]|nr:hypothetical protein [Fimbriimonadaceae bacterium]
MMRRTTVRGWLAVLLAVGLASAAPPEVLPVSAIKAGLKGQGLTVVRGTAIESFEFEVLDVLETEGFASSLLLVKLRGPLIDRCGGIAAGMSGSPLLADGKLVGAVAFTTPFADTTIGYATPLADMLKVFDLGAPAAAPRVGRAGLAGLPVGTAVQLSGLRGRPRAVLASFLRRRGLRLVDEPAAPSTSLTAPPAPGELQPGSAVAASLSTGDIVLTALGTLSYRDGDKVLAFGHPFLQSGPTSLFLHPAFIYGVIPSQELSFKVGAPAGPPLGCFTQDRAAGLGGWLGRAADSLSVQVDAGDSALGRRRTLQVQVVRDETLTPTLAAVVVMQAVAEVMDRSGGGTAELAWSLSGPELPATLRRSDLVYHSDDILGEVLPGPLFALDALLRNDFRAVRPEQLQVKVTVSPERRTTRLVSASLDPARVKPGETVTVVARLQPYRAAAAEQVLRLRVPPTASPGALWLELHGRPAGSGLSQAALLAQGTPPPRDFDELCRLLCLGQRGNALQAELLTAEAADWRDAALARRGPQPAFDPLSEELSIATLGELGTAAVLPTAREEVLLEQVVQGRLRLPLTVLQP